jgi:hypothetical protein
MDGMAIQQQCAWIGCWRQSAIDLESIVIKETSKKPKEMGLGDTMRRGGSFSSLVWC